jgi:hypothetical protein
VSTAGWVVLATVGALGAFGLAVAFARLRRAEERIAGLETRLGDVSPALEAARDEAHAAGVTARRAALAAGVGEPPPRLALERVTGPVVKAVAFGAGLRRALSRLTRSPRRTRDRAVPTEDPMR